MPLKLDSSFTEDFFKVSPAGPGPAREWMKLRKYAVKLANLKFLRAKKLINQDNSGMKAFYVNSLVNQSAKQLGIEENIDEVALPLREDLLNDLERLFGQASRGISMLLLGRAQEFIRNFSEALSDERVVMEEKLNQPISDRERRTYQNLIASGDVLIRRLEPLLSTHQHLAYLAYLRLLVEFPNVLRLRKIDPKESFSPFIDNILNLLTPLIGKLSTFAQSTGNKNLAVWGEKLVAYRDQIAALGTEIRENLDNNSMSFAWRNMQRNKLVETIIATNRFIAQVRRFVSPFVEILDAIDRSYFQEIDRALSASSLIKRIVANLDLRSRIERLKKHTTQEQLIEFFREIENDLNHYGVDEQFKFSHLILPEGALRHESEMELYLSVSLINRLKNAGFVKLDEMPVSDTASAFYLPEEGLDYMFVVDGDTRVPFLSYLAQADLKQIRDNLSDDLVYEALPYFSGPSGEIFYKKLFAAYPLREIFSWFPDDVSRKKFFNKLNPEIILTSELQRAPLTMKEALKRIDEFSNNRLVYDTLLLATLRVYHTQRLNKLQRQDSEHKAEGPSLGQNLPATLFDHSREDARLKAAQVLLAGGQVQEEGIKKTLQTGTLGEIYKRLNPSRM